MSYVLNSALYYLVNGQEGGYIYDASGECSTVNADAMLLLCSDDPAWVQDSDYAEFAKLATTLEWLVPGTYSTAIVRRIDTEHHLRRLQYEINLLCNLECTHCYCSSSPRAPGGQSTEFVKDLIDQASAMGVIYFDVTGGEPLARKDIYEVISHIRERNMVAGLYTNGTLITNEVAGRLQQSGVANVQVSLDALTPEIHDRIRGKKGAFRRAVSGIRALQSVGIAVHVAVTVNKLNAHEIPELIAFLRDDLKVAYSLDRVIPAGRGISNSDSIAMTNEEFYSLAYSLFTPEEAPLTKVCDSPGALNSETRVEPGCGVGVSYAFLKYDGRLALCPTMTESESPEFRQGSLHGTSLQEVWLNHPTFRSYRHVQCKNVQICSAGNTCRGGCRSNAYILHGSVDSPDEWYCNLHKNRSPKYINFIEQYEGKSSLRAKDKIAIVPIFEVQD